MKSSTTIILFIIVIVTITGCKPPPPEIEYATFVKAMDICEDNQGLNRLDYVENWLDDAQTQLEFKLCAYCEDGTRHHLKTHVVELAKP